MSKQRFVPIKINVPALKERKHKQMVCDCLHPDTCAVKYHLTAKARAQQLPDRIKELKEIVVKFAEVVEAVERCLPRRAA